MTDQTRTVEIPAFLEMKDGCFVSYDKVLASADLQAKVADKRQLTAVKRKLGLK